MVILSVVIPTYNNEKDLPQCLESIKRQRYPPNNLEILVSDGGSKDHTVAIALSYGCRVINNKNRLAEYGVPLGIQKAKGTYVTILASDNELKGAEYFKKILKPFQNKRIALSYPLQDSTQDDTWISRYINTFTDPVNHFIYWNAANTRTFNKQYGTREQTVDYCIYGFTEVDYPLIALAQGTTVVKKYIVGKLHAGDDILPLISLIRQGYVFAYIPDATVYHHTSKSLRTFVRKQQWALDNYLFGKNYGFGKRELYFSFFRKTRQRLWPFYAASIIMPLSISIWGLISQRKWEWLYHPMLTTLTLVTLVFEYFRVTIIGKKTHRERKV